VFAQSIPNAFEIRYLEEAMTMTKSILCFGDSLTWGWIPVLEGAPTLRYPYQQRWTGVMAEELGNGYHIIEEGLSARTTSADDPNDPRLNGSQYLPSAIASHLPLDLVIIMLGTNDTKPFFNRTPYDIAYGMAKLVGQVLTGAHGVGTSYPAPKCLVVAPPPLTPMPHPFFQGMFCGGHEKTKELAQQYRDMADFIKVDFLDAGEVIKTEGCDGIHFTAENNRDLGKAIARKVSDIFVRLDSLAT
jgi:lysophospholipase L1-like esterase